jgi:hypothetical protein
MGEWHGKSYLFRFPEDVLTRFEFYRLAGDHIVVHLVLPPKAGTCRTQHAQFGLPLPIPPLIRAPTLVAITPDRVIDAGRKDDRWHAGNDCSLQRGEIRSGLTGSTHAPSNQSIIDDLDHRGQGERDYPVLAALCPDAH